ncbi:mitochondrial hypoxia responsive domain-containing protein [Decorospora gaudefroyi]|uniref:Mitochondrial hypoxia responsive domain-containing protein n=1 Tax=Decorospora gaudefroyi TaxID=184978 RepID=A0A6A5K7W3_9PLEO|nr:mitochondrial hypoxia responsive domain-containing protein [Decorospora gaudefroyi]
MKVLTKEEEEAHYYATVKGGTIGGVVGLAIGGAAVSLASRRYHSFRALTVPFRAFLVASAGTFIAVIEADRASAQYAIEHTPEKKRQIEREKEREALYDHDKTALQRAKTWATENRYPLLFGFWIASMAGSWHFVNRNPYLSGSQKLVQARMYAQGGTLTALLASFAIEGADAAKGKGRWETIRVIDPNDPEHKHVIEKKIHRERYPGEDQWRDMVVAEEQREKERAAARQGQQNKAKEHEDNADHMEEKATEEEEATEKENQKKKNKA